MPGYSLVPVDYQPDFSDYSLVPVDYDPFEADGATQPPQTQPVQNQPENPPQQPATGPDLPNVGAPLIGDGGQFSPGVPWANKAADIASKFVYGAIVGLATLPQRALQASAQDAQHLGEDDYVPQSVGPAADTALILAGAGAPMAETSAAGAFGGKLVRVIGEHLHHPWPKYLGGAVEQELVSLPKSLHYEFHSGLDQVLPRRKSTAFYESLGPEERQRTLQALGEYTKKFDADHGTKLYDALLRNGFPAP